MHEFPLAQFKNFKLSWKFSFICSLCMVSSTSFMSHDDDHWARPLGHRQSPIYECMSPNSVLATRSIYLVSMRTCGSCACWFYNFGVHDNGPFFSIWLIYTHCTIFLWNSFMRLIVGGMSEPFFYRFAKFQFWIVLSMHVVHTKLLHMECQFSFLQVTYFVACSNAVYMSTRWLKSQYCGDNSCVH